MSGHGFLQRMMHLSGTNGEIHQKNNTIGIYIATKPRKDMETCPHHLSCNHWGWVKSICVCLRGRDIATDMWFLLRKISIFICQNDVYHAIIQVKFCQFLGCTVTWPLAIWFVSSSCGTSETSETYEGFLKWGYLITPNYPNLDHLELKPMVSGINYPFLETPYHSLFLLYSWALHFWGRYVETFHDLSDFFHWVWPITAVLRNSHMFVQYFWG